MYYRKNDVLPTEESATLNPVYATPSIAKKLHGIFCHQQEQSFDQTELALMEHVTHQRISALLKHILAKPSGFFSGTASTWMCCCTT